MKKTLHRWWSKFLDMFGNIKCFRFPMFLVYDPDDFQITGEDTLKIQEVLQPGDILLRGYNNYLDGKFIDLFSISTKHSKIGQGWSHGAVYVGKSKIVHAVSEGVSLTNVIEFTRCDRICIFRPKHYQRDAIKTARQFLKDNVPYDFSFEHGASALYCFELCYECYKKLHIPRFSVKKLLGLISKKDVVLANSFLASNDMDLVLCFNKSARIHFISKK